MSINRLPLDLGQSNPQTQVQRAAAAQQQQQLLAAAAAASNDGVEADADAVSQLLIMGGGQWSLNFCARAAVASDNNLARAVEWCFSQNGEGEPEPEVEEAEPPLGTRSLANIEKGPTPPGTTISTSVPSGADMLRMFYDASPSDGVLDVSAACGDQVTQEAIRSLGDCLLETHSWKTTALASLRLHSTGQQPVKLAFSAPVEEHSRNYVLNSVAVDIDLGGRCLGSADVGLLAAWLEWRDVKTRSLILRNNLLIGNGKTQTQQEFDQHGDFTPSDYQGFTALCRSLAAMGGEVGGKVNSTCLDLSRCKLDAKATDILARSVPMNMAGLNLSGNPISGAKWDGVAWKNPVITMPGYVHLDQFGDTCTLLRHVTRLNLSGCQLGSADMKHVASLCCASDSSVEWLSIVGNPTSADFPCEEMERAFTDTTRLCTLLGIDEGVKELDLTNTASAIETGVVNLLGLGEIFEQTIGIGHAHLLAVELRLCRSTSHLKRLVLDGNLLGGIDRDLFFSEETNSGEVDRLMGAIALSAIEVLRIRSCGFGPSAFGKQLRQLLSSTSLTDLDVSHNTLAGGSQDDWHQFCVALSKSAVASLRIESCSIGPEFAAALSQRIGDSSLTAISILGNPIGTAGAQALIDSFADAPQILTLMGIEANTVELDLSNKGIDSGQAEVLAAELAGGRNAVHIQCLTTASTGSPALKSVNMGSGVVILQPKADVERSGPRAFVLNSTDIYLDLSKKNLGPADIHILRSWLQKDNVVATQLNLCGNPLASGVDDLIEILQENSERIQTVCGFENQACEINWADSQKSVTDIRLLTIELTFGRAVATSGLSVDLSSNPAIVGAVDKRFRLRSPDSHIAELAALLGTLESRVVDLNLSGCGLGPVAATTLAEFISKANGLTTIHASNNLLFGSILKGEDGTAPVASKQKIDLQPPSDGFTMNLFGLGSTEGTSAPDLESAPQHLQDQDVDSDSSALMLTRVTDSGSDSSVSSARHRHWSAFGSDLGENDSEEDWNTPSEDTSAEDKHFALINHNTGRDQHGWTAICSAICVSSLETFYAVNIGMDPVGCQALAQSISTLRHIDISDNAVFGTKVADTFFGTEIENAVDVEQAGWKALCESVKSSQIATLIATGIGMGPEGCLHLCAAVSDSSALQSITLDSTGDLRGKMIGDSKRGQQPYTLDASATEIRLRERNIGPADVTLLEAWLAKPDVAGTVELIDVLDNPTGDSVDGLINFYRRNDKVQTLLGVGTDEQTHIDFSGKNMDLGQAKMLSAELCAGRVLTSVESIDLSSNELGANGADSLMVAMIESKISSITSVRHDDSVQADAATFFLRWTTLNRRLVGALPEELAATVDDDLAAFAARYSHPIMIEFFVSSDSTSVSAFISFLTGQGLCEPDVEGVTTLAHVAASNCHVGLLKALVGLGADPDARDEQGRSVIQLAEVSESEETRLWGRTLTAFLGRYKLDHGANIHRSRTAKTHYATDELQKNTLVVLKWMKNRSEFESEISARYVNGSSLSSTAVIPVVGWHTPEDQPFSDSSGQTQEMQSTSGSDVYPYVLVLKQGERSLHDVCAKERIAGYDVAAVVETVKSVAQCVAELHHMGICHGDLKQRNILRLKDRSTTSWILCDMDASACFGCPIGQKTSSAYAPPELAQHKFANGGSVLSVASFDIWSLGVILFELCCGRTLFAQDINNDDLVDIDDRTRLCTWLCINDDQLATVFSDADVSADVVQDAKHLIRWCLMGDPEERPTVAQVLSHAFLISEFGPRPVLRMRYHAFMSHAQADASGTVGTLFFSYQQLGLYNWIDMRQEQLTLEGMRQGVRDSNVFLLVLSERVLASWFCQQEMLTAIDEGKPIQLVLEQEARFRPFDLKSWTAQAASGTSARTIAIQGNQIEIPPRIAAMVDENLPRAVTYRRRDFENNAMMRELCFRNGIVLPCSSVETWPADRATVKVFVIFNDRNAAPMLQELQDGTADLRDRVMFTTDAGTLADVDRVLVLLTAGVLQPPSLQTLMRAIALDKAQSRDRIVALYSELAGWQFGCEEHKTAPLDVQSCLDEHEAIAYRPSDPSGSTRHEFPAMIQQLLSKLGANRGPRGGTLQREPSTVVPVAGVRDRLASCERALAVNAVALEDAQALVQRQASELAKLRAHMSSAEGVPPI